MSFVPTDHDSSIASGWQTQWLQRTLPALDSYEMYTHFILTVGMLALGLCWVYYRIMTFPDPSDHEESLNKTKKRDLALSKGLLAIAVIYLLEANAIYFVDVFICLRSMIAQLSNHPELHATLSFFDVAYCLVWVFALAFGILVAVPLIQLTMVAAILSCFMRVRSEGPIAKHIPQARFVSTFIALMYAMVFFVFVAECSPITNESKIRVFIPMVVLGSALFWLKVSFICNFCVGKIEQERLVASEEGGFLELLVLSFRIARAANKRSDTEALPTDEQAQDK